MHDYYGVQWLMGAAGVHTLLVMAQDKIGISKTLYVFFS